jgi:hypothetical protein
LIGRELFDSPLTIGFLDLIEASPILFRIFDLKHHQLAPLEKRFALR